jgi:hypothetical protein
VSERRKPLGLLIVEKVGMRNGVRCLSFIVSWGIVFEALGHEPNMEEYTAYWKQSRATSYRERDAFQLVWPYEKNPAAIWAQIRDSVPERKRVDTASAQAFSVAVLR